MAGFVLADILKGTDVPKMGAGLQQIPIGRLHPDPNNFYTVDPDSVRELAGNIATIGLQQPLNVRPDGEDYTVISGHRRLAALRLLVDEDERQDLAVVPCMVVDSGSEALNELRLIYGNANTRRLSDWELAKTAERVEALFYQLKEEGFDFPGRMRDHVAAACQASKSKLARLKVIREKLKPEVFRKAFERGSLRESTAYEIARREEAVQDRAAEGLSWYLHASADEVADALDMAERNLAEEQATVLAVADGLAAVSGDKTGEDQANAYLEMRAEENKKYFAVMTDLARFFSRRMPEVLMDRAANIDLLKNTLRNSGGNPYGHDYWATASVLQLSPESEQWNHINRTWTEAYDALAAACIRIVAGLPDEDEEPETLPVQWMDGDPPRPGYYWVRAVDDDWTFTDNARWDGDEWNVMGSSEIKVTGWWPLPEV